MTAKQILDLYIKFFEERGHVRIENSSLVPLNDPTTLFTSSGMQPLVPYLLGEAHPAGKRLVNAQNSFRAQDIDEIGDNRHTTFFRMLGNWSLGDYFKKEQIPWFFEFLTSELKLDPQKLFVTVFSGFDSIPEDEESISIWQEEFKKAGMEAKLGDRIFTYGAEKNWWSRAGIPEKMPVGEPGGPDTEVFYELPIEHDKKFGETCHVNCDCGKYVEIGNSVFMQYIKVQDGFSALPQKNVDFGGGLERLVLVTEGKTDIFETSLFAPIIESIQKNIMKKFNYKDDSRITRAFRIIADHLVASTFIINSGVFPTNKDRGSVLRRLIRRAIAQKFLWGDKIATFKPVIEAITQNYADTDPELAKNSNSIIEVIAEEELKANKAIEEAFKVWARWVQDHPASGTFGGALWGTTPFGGGGKMPPLSAEKMFDLYQSYGLSIDIIEEVTHGHIDKEGFEELLNKHKDLSRAGLDKKFAGGLADHSEKTIMGHTATHLMHQALRDMFGSQLHQTGSNITSERVRFDFNFDRKLTKEELDSLEKTVNEKISENLPVYFEMMPVERAKEIGAIGLFDEKYARDVKVYFMGEYSKEFCGGPHVDFTGEVKRFTIMKQESLGRGMQRIYAEVG